jgi:Putative serine esterase (DUF676)
VSKLSFQDEYSVTKLGRYTVTYTPSADRILPAPRQLYVKIRNTSAVPLRAAYLHGPYTLYVACYPSTFDPNKKHENHKQEGSPDFEPNLKAGGQWNSKLSVPQDIRDAVGSTPSRQSLEGTSRSFSWIIEIASQVIFSTSAAVHFEVLVGRDERSVELGSYPTAATELGGPGKLDDHIQNRTNKPTQAKGVYSKAVRLVVDDTTSLWNSPAFPAWEGEEGGGSHGQTKEKVLDDEHDKQRKQERPSKKKQKVHLVILTHGIHSNVGADMLFLKESIDATAKQARKDARMRRAQMKAGRVKTENDSNDGKGDRRSMSSPEIAVPPTSETYGNDPKEEEDDEQVIVRGFGENVVRTERGIQYMGKRLAKYVLSITYPDQPYLPVKSSISKTIARSLTGQKATGGESQPAHKNSSIHKNEEHINDNLAYQITSISFVGHSLGGLTQTYAIAYIQKHSPDFFDRIKPINFVAMASPFLGLSNENPVYVKFALDFGLVGRTGQDLGLTWRTPTMIRSGWGTMIGGLGNENQKNKTGADPGAKPLLRILPTGPAHAALKSFRNRSVYSNVVNDGIVPLRTSCLLFLDWRGLGRVEKARRDNGIVGTMVGWGWAEMTGQNASSPKAARPWADFFNDSGEESDTKKSSRQSDPGDDVPQPGETVMNEDNISARNVPVEPKSHQFLDGKHSEDEVHDQQKPKQASSAQPSTAWSGFLSLFKPQASSKSHLHPPKHTKIYRRGQTTGISPDTDSDSADNSDLPSNKRKPMVRGPSLYSNNSANENMEAPPKTTFFESAGDLLKPPLPSEEFFIDPASRPRTIFHDRVYHPEDIPAPEVKPARSVLRRSISRDTVPKASLNDSANISVSTSSLNVPDSNADTSDMKIEEKIARAYHRDLSWRKVLVRLEPDAHNNMIVRRMFANAYGWPVIKHMCDTHFGFTASAIMEDAMETNTERAKGTEEQVSRAGEQVQGQRDPPAINKDEMRGRETEPERSMSDGYHPLEKMTSPDLERLKRPPKRTNSEIREASDEVGNLEVTSATVESSMSSSATKSTVPDKLARRDSARWSDRFFEGSDDDSDVEYLASPTAARRASKDSDAPRGTSEADIAKFLGQSTPAKGSPKPLLTDRFTSPPRPLRSRDGKTRTTDSNEVAVVPDPATVGLTGVGLGKSVEEQVSPQRERGNGIPQQVAVAAAEQERKKAGG